MSQDLLPLLLGVIQLLGVFSAIHATLKVRTSQGTVAWVLGLLLLPYLTLPFYWVFGRKRFHGYIDTMREAQQQLGRYRLADILSKFRAELPVQLDDSFGLLAGLNDSVYTQGNALTLLVNGEKTFSALFDAIHKAQHYLLIQFFIIRDDDLGKKLQAALLEKAKQGVRVYVLYDEIGSHALSYRYLRILREGNITVFPFNTGRGWLNRLQLNFRNHRKIVIADGCTAFTGGLNVGDEYLGLGDMGEWRDTFVKLEGPAVQALQHSFATDWYWASHEILQLNWRPEPVGQQTVLIHASGPADRLDNCSLFFHQAIAGAKHRLWIASPYFVPSSSVFETLQLAALRGVDVRILLPEKSDSKLVYLASFAFLEAAGRSGIKIYRYQSGFLHQKVVLVDDHIAAIGTANLDNRSLYLNFEIMAVVVDAGFAAQVETMLEIDFELSRQATVADLQTRSWLFRWAVRVARLFDPIL